MKMDLDIMKLVYRQLQDEESRKIFEYRLLYSMTQDKKYIDKLIEDVPEKKKLDKMIERCKANSDAIVYYGAGNDLHILTSLYPDIEISCICDKNHKKQKDGWRGIPVISPDELLGKKEVFIAIVTTGFHKEIKEFLLQSSIPEENIIDLGEVTEELYNKQYFDNDVIFPKEEGVFIDGGCYDCSTSVAFINWCKDNYRKIYGFEPDAENYKKCKDKIKYLNLENIEILNKGLWDCTEELSFIANQEQGSRIVNEDSVVEKILVTSIDETAGDEEVTFIKLDVEGAELKALQGAKNTILKNRPKLAISIYHKLEDIFEIPAYILSLNSDYKFFLRHYQLSENETILYAL